MPVRKLPNHQFSLAGNLLSRILKKFSLLLFRVIAALPALSMQILSSLLKPECAKYILNILLQKEFHLLLLAAAVQIIFPNADMILSKSISAYSLNLSLLLQKLLQIKQQSFLIMQNSTKSN